MNLPISLGALVTLTNVGSTYDAIAASKGLGCALIDFTGVSSVGVAVEVGKIGTGTQSWQFWNETDGVEIGVFNDAGAAGDKTLSATISNGLPTGEKLVRIRCKSTVAADDPVYYGATILLRRPTATFERAGLVTQLIANAYGLTRDMRDNANGYKSQVTAGRDVTGIAAVMVADAIAYLVRIQWITDAVTRNQSLVTNALADLGLALSDATALRDTLTTVANHTKAATLTTGAQVNTEADFILASVPSFERLW